MDCGWQHITETVDSETMDNRELLQSKQGEDYSEGITFQSALREKKNRLNSRTDPIGR